MMIAHHFFCLYRQIRPNPNRKNVFIYFGNKVIWLKKKKDWIFLNKNKILFLDTVVYFACVKGISKHCTYFNSITPSHSENQKQVPSLCLLHELFFPFLHQSATRGQSKCFVSFFKGFILFLFVFYNLLD